MVIIVIEFLFYTFFPLVLGFISSLFSNTSLMYDGFIKPFLSPPSIIFPIVWTILYILMGLSSYKVRKDKTSMKLFYVQLTINVIWTLIFFNLRNYLQGFILIILLIILVSLMIKRFYKINKTAAYMNIPYLIWLIFASYLSLSIYLLNM